MMSSLPWDLAPSESELKRSLRRAAALLLQGLARRLASAAQHLATAEQQQALVSRIPVLEFHAEAGAPEGALYVDGCLVGYLTGVTRL